MKVKSESEVAQLCLTLHDPMDCSLPGSSVHGIFQARVLEWGAIAFSTPGPCISGGAACTDYEQEPWSLTSTVTPSLHHRCSSRWEQAAQHL